MSEPKQSLALEVKKTMKASQVSDPKQPPSLDSKKSSKMSEKERRTIVIELKLFEPTKEEYPEFSVPELLYKERKREERRLKQKSPGPSPEMSFEQPFNNDSEDDEDVRRLAEKMNEKYGTGSGYDINDKAVGYDESDSFIDNTEAFDEMIMDDTPKGGFYINSGPLVFKTKEKGSSATGKKRQSMDTEDESKSGKKKFRTEVKKKKSKTSKEPAVEEPKEKVMSMKDAIRLKRDNARKNRIVSDDEDSDSQSEESSEDSDVKIVEPNPLPPGLPDSVLNLIKEYKTAAEKQDVIKASDIREEISRSSITPDTVAKVNSYLSSLFSLRPAPPPPEPAGRDLPLLD